MNRNDSVNWHIVDRNSVPVPAAKMPLSQKPDGSYGKPVPNNFQNFSDAADIIRMLLVPVGELFAVRA